MSLAHTPWSVTYSVLVCKNIAYLDPETPQISLLPWTSNWSLHCFALRKPVVRWGFYDREQARDCGGTTRHILADGGASVYSVDITGMRMLEVLGIMRVIECCHKLRIWYQRGQHCTGGAGVEMELRQVHDMKHKLEWCSS